MSKVPDQEYKGARWVRVDLHLHSPGAKSFSYPRRLNAKHKDQVVREYVNQLKKQDVKIAAITDYQQIRTKWFRVIREKAIKEGIYIYPGVELSFGGDTAGKGGLHVLAVFPFDADVEQINRAIDKLLDAQAGAPLVEEDGSHRDLIPERTLTDSLLNLREETGCLIIFPHPNNDKGLLKSFKPKQAAEILATTFPEAVEELGEEDRELLLSTGAISRDVLARIASVSSSDNHSVQEIGTKLRPSGEPRSTYIKLSVLDDLGAIRLSLRDNRILVRHPSSHRKVL